MPIPVECDYCGQRFRVREELAGEELPCKSCGEYFRVPSRSRRIQGRPDRRRPTSRTSETGPNVPLIAAIVGAVLIGCGAMIWLIASKSNNARPDAVADGDSTNNSTIDAGGSVTNGGDLFPVESVPVPRFPPLPPPQRHTSGAKIFFVDLNRTPGLNSGPGSRMAMRVYLPAGEHAAGSLGCVLVAPAGTNLLRGNSMDADDYHDETLPYVNAGYAVVFYSIDGIMRDADNPTNAEFARAYEEFKAAHAGVVNGRNALEFVLDKLPQVDPKRIYSAGHSSAGVLSLLLAEHEPRIQGAIAYAPATDVELRLAELLDHPQIPQLLPGVKTFLRQSSPKTHGDKFGCPVFLFHARDDSNEPIQTTEAFAKQLESAGKEVTFKQVARGNHYQSMIDAGIPAAIAWLKQLPGERGKTYPEPARNPTASNDNRPGRSPFRPPSFGSPGFGPPSMPRIPSGIPGRGGVQRTMTFEMLSYSGQGDATETARRVLRRYPWCVADTVQVEANQVVIEVRGGIINSGPIKSALQRTGFQLGGVSIRSQ